MRSTASVGGGRSPLSLGVNIRHYLTKPVKQSWAIFCFALILIVGAMLLFQSEGAVLRAIRTHEPIEDQCRVVGSRDVMTNSPPCDGLGTTPVL